MIDAEQTYFQPAIDNTITDLQVRSTSPSSSTHLPLTDTQVLMPLPNLQRRYNREYPAVFGTYQCYLKDAHTRLKDDMGRAKRHNYHFAAKLVGGEKSR